MRPHKIVLYNPAAVFYTMPLGLLAIGSALNPEKYRVIIVDARLERDALRAVLEQVDGALCLGVTVLTGRPIHDALRVCRAVKTAHPRLPVIWGGWHPSLFQTECLEEPSIDITAAGQGEETFADLVERLAGGDPLEGCMGVAFRKNGTVTVNPPRPLRPLDAFPAHNYGLIPVERYFDLKRCRQLDYISSQGCRFRCAFCADPQVYARGWTGLDPARTGHEVARLAQRYDMTELAFQDETFFTSVKRVEAIADAFLSARLAISWTATMRADQGARLPEEALVQAIRAGLRRVMIGVESGDQAMLDHLEKDITVEQVIISAEKCLRHGIGVIFPFIVGLPGETGDQLAATMELIKRLRRMSSRFETPIFFYKPYPGSPVAEEARRAGYVMPDTLEKWAAFDYVASDGSDNVWMDRDRRRMIQRFRFYQQHAFGTHPRALHRPLQMLSGWRCHRDFYRLPLEKLVVERLFPAPRLS